jgi:hypothetical protein
VTDPKHVERLKHWRKIGFGKAFCAYAVSYAAKMTAWTKVAKIRLGLHTNRFLKHWRKIGFGKALRAHVISYTAKVMAWTKATMTGLGFTRPMTVHTRRGLRKLSPDLISKARDETAAQVTRIGLTFLGTVAFCLMSLLSSDSALLGGNEKINVPFAGPVSFFGFMLLGPAVLIVLRVHLQIYVEHGERLDRLAQRMPAVRAPTLVPLQNPLIRIFSGLIFYLLLPVATLLFAWKAAVFPAWGLGLLCVAVGVIASHVMAPMRWFSWRTKAISSRRAAPVDCRTSSEPDHPQRGRSSLARRAAAFRRKKA